MCDFKDKSPNVKAKFFQESQCYREKAGNTVCISNLTETEEQILNNILNISKNKTTIIVSHRVSSAKNADKIIILEDGIIIQEGTHNQLLNQKGYYAELYYKQLTEKEIN